MARRRGFLAELQHQQRVAQQRASAAQRAQVAAYNQAQRARAAAERAAAAAARADERERARLEREAKAAYIEARVAEAAAMTEELDNVYRDIDGLLAATLEVDDYVDLASLKQPAVHPPFDRPDLETPIPSPAPIAIPPQPILRPIERPKGLFGKKRKIAEAEAVARAEYDAAMHTWDAQRRTIPALEAEAQAKHAAAEQDRIAKLTAEQARYAEESRQREIAADEQNQKIDALIAGLGYGAADAVNEYVGIVLANSVYPEHFEVEHDAEFVPATAELQLRVVIPAPDAVPTAKSFKYNRTDDSIVATQLPKKDVTDRYAGAVQQVALRSLHEIFEADRRGIVKAISVQVGPRTKDPATGLDRFLPLAAVTATRETFTAFDLSGVVPAATLQHLGAAVSKNPIALVTIDPAGVRRA